MKLRTTRQEAFFSPGPASLIFHLIIGFSHLFCCMISHAVSRSSSLPGYRGCVPWFYKIKIRKKLKKIPMGNHFAADENVSEEFSLLSVFTAFKFTEYVKELKIQIKFHSEKPPLCKTSSWLYSQSNESKTFLWLDLKFLWSLYHHQGGKSLHSPPKLTLKTMVYRFLTHKASRWRLTLLLKKIPVSSLVSFFLWLKKASHAIFILLRWTWLNPWRSLLVINSISNLILCLDPNQGHFSKPCKSKVQLEKYLQSQAIVVNFTQPCSDKSAV